MYTLSYVLYGIGGVAVLILLGFTIALFKKKGTAKTNKIAIIISVLVAVASFGYGGYHQYDINQTIEAADDEFADNADKFTKLYKTTYDDIEESGNSIKDSWTKEIVEAAADDEKADITSIVEEALVDNQESIDNSTTNIHKLKKYLDTMNDYDTGEYDYDAYNKAYKRLNSLINYVSDPSGSLTSYSDKLDTLVSDVDDAYKDIE